MDIHRADRNEKRINNSFWLQITFRLVFCWSTNDLSSRSTLSQVPLLILWVHHDTIQTAVPAAALSLTTALAIVILSAIEHNRSVRPSSLLSIYLLVSIFLDAVQARTLFIRHRPFSIVVTFTAGIAAKVLLLTLEFRNKRHYLRSFYRQYPPELTSGIFNRTVFWWLNSLLVGGFRKILSLEDFFSPDEALKSAPLKEKIQAAWERHRSKEKASLIYATVACLQWPILRIIFPRLCLIGFTYAQTFFIHRAISYLSEPDTPTIRNDRYGLIGAAALIYGGIAISTVHYKHQLFRLITMFRGEVISLIYTRTLSLRAASMMNQPQLLS
ncbi:hypothetical protein VTN77DRAFT_1836 [Rasamsonia byssochlamydoides]|uniref:uncharacterized protein n=1 Tax=Rasamsonia byssochlamydoides TaxID=89139 RepID=UPI00374376AD